jgi:hypothetical protein
MDKLIDLDAVAAELEQRRAVWTAAGITVGPLTWRDAAADWPQALVTDRSAVIDPESVGVRLSDDGQETELVLWTGGWADLAALIAGVPINETPEFGDVGACMAVADDLFARLRP